MDYCSASASTSPNLSERGELLLQPQELRWLSSMFKSSWSSLSPLERFVSTLVTRISQSPRYVTQLSAIDSSRSPYISSALLGRILKITVGIRLSCPSLPCCEGNELKEVVSCAEGLLWADLAPGGRTNLQTLSGSCHIHWPLQFPRFQWTAGKSSRLPALTPAPYRKKAALPLLPEQEEEKGRKRREGENTSGINWRALNALERTAELAETIARSRVFGRDSAAKVENETYAAYLNTKPELLLRLWGFFHASS